MNHFVAELIHFDMFGYLAGKHLISGSQKGKPPPPWRTATETAESTDA
jgi:hypothetical protein